MGLTGLNVQFPLSLELCSPGYLLMTELLSPVRVKWPGWPGRTRVAQEDLGGRGGLVNLC